MFDIRGLLAAACLPSCRYSSLNKITQPINKVVIKTTINAGKSLLMRRE